MFCHQPKARPPQAKLPRLKTRCKPLPGTGRIYASPTRRCRPSGTAPGTSIFNSLRRALIGSNDLRSRKVLRVSGSSTKLRAPSFNLIGSRPWNISTAARPSAAFIRSGVAQNDDCQPRLLGSTRAQVIGLDAVSEKPTFLFQLIDRSQDRRICVTGRSVTFPTSVGNLAPAVRHALPTLRPKESFSQDGTSSDLVGAVSSRRQAENVGKTVRRSPMKREPPVPVSGTHAICHCWEKRFGIRERR
jgi:hypothetical protein